MGTVGTRPALWEKYDSWHARGPGVGPDYALRTVAKLAIWPPLLFVIRVIDSGLSLLYYMLHARFVYNAICTIFAAWNKQFETLATTCCCGKNTALCMPCVVVCYTLRDEQDKSGTCKQAQALAEHQHEMTCADAASSCFYHEMHGFSDLFQAE